jgi:hypothetical protein
VTRSVATETKKINTATNAIFQATEPMNSL